MSVINSANLKEGGWIQKARIMLDALHVIVYVRNSMYNSVTISVLHQARFDGLTRCHNLAAQSVDANVSPMMIYYAQFNVLGGE